MSNCKRDHADPLLQLLLGTYHLNMLRIPQEGLAVGELVIEQQKGTATIRCPLTEVFTGKLPNLKGPKDDSITALEDESSGKLKTKAGLSFLDKLLRFVPGASAKAAGAYNQVEHVAIKLKMLTRETVNFGTLSNFLGAAEIKEDQSLFQEGDRLFVITAIVRSSGIQIHSTDAAGQALDAKLGVKGFGEGNLRVDAESKGGGRMLYTGKKALAIGVELFGIEPVGGKFKLRATNEPVAVREGTLDTTEKDYAWIGDRATGDAFFDLSSNQ
ncbi:hypothetical protein ABIC03_007802 [Bradyrhizobium sp. RT6a]|uniref:gasdermin n=1 Tax=Bradyrhizobium sp. RT6a TaxID=3156381 RepID=UPI0033986805